MKFQTQEKEGICIVKVTGDMTGGPHAQQFHQCFLDQLETGQLRFIVDISGARFINSIGIGMLIGAFTSVVRKGGMMRLVAPRSTRGWTVLAIVKLFRIIETYDTIEEALTAFANDSTFQIEKTNEPPAEASA